MSTDKHFNEKGQVPEPLEDHEGTDMPAVRNMYIIIALVAALAIVVLMTAALMG